MEQRSQELHLERGRAHRTGSSSPHASIWTPFEGQRERNVKLLQNPVDLAPTDAKVAGEGTVGRSPSSL